MRKLIGLLGNLEATKSVSAQMAAFSAATALGSVYEDSLSDLTPKVTNGVFGDSAVRKVSSKLQLSIPVGLTAGKAVSTPQEISAYTDKIANDYAPRGWSSDYFYNNSFLFTPKNGIYSAEFSRQEDAERMSELLGLDFIVVSVFNNNEEVPANFVGLKIILGEKKQKEKTIKLLEEIKSKFFKK